MADFDITFNRQEIKRIAASAELRDGLAILGQIAETEAKNLAPVDTGNLRRSITHVVERDRRGWVMRYGTNVRYAIFQEIGTRFHPPQPFLRPALEALRRFLSA